MAERILGPEGGRRRRKAKWILGLIAACAAMLFVVVGASGNLSGSTFEGNDGNLVVNTPGNHDWVNAPNLSVGVDLPTGTQDNSFGQGSKEDNVDVNVVGGSIPNSKADLARFALAGEVIGNDTYMYLAWSRENQSGTVNFDFELNKVAQPDLTTPGPKHLNRSVNDLLINYAFQGGSNTPTLTRYHWDGSQWVSDGVISSTCSEGATNAATVSENLGGQYRRRSPRPAVRRGSDQPHLRRHRSARCTVRASARVMSSPAPRPHSRRRSRTSSHRSRCTSPTAASSPSSNTRTLAILTRTSATRRPAGLSPSTFSLNDHATDTQVFDNLHAGTYTVTEGADPSGFAFASLNCVGTGGSVSGETATAVIVGGSDITCTYINNQQLGAIRVTKESTKNGNPPLAGATFSVTGPGGFSTTLTTGADGTACVDGLTFGNYSVTETAAPTGYNLDDTTAHTVAVNVNTTCSGSPQGTGAAFLDTPKTDIAASATSQAAGGTASHITCVDGHGTTVGESAAGNTDPASASATGLSPGTYTCTIVIDP